MLVFGTCVLIDCSNKSEFQFLFEVQKLDFGGGVQTIIITMVILVAEALWKTNFPTMLFGGVQGQEKRRPKHKCYGKQM